MGLGNYHYAAQIRDLQTEVAKQDSRIHGLRTENEALRELVNDVCLALDARDLTNTEWKEIFERGLKLLGDDE